nr:type 2 isopentenyl-diphosphate Delta-isomerase [Candidatus Njordarchaeum guaymaensis]
MVTDTSGGKEEENEKIVKLTSKRKIDHIQISLTKDVQAAQKKTGFEEVELIHNALPEIDMKDVETATELFGRKLNAPLIIAGMTGGHPIAKRINMVLAKVAQEMRIGMGVGSQRVAIEDPSLAETFSIVRKLAPDTLIIANIGAPQLAKGYGLREARKAVEMIEADALAIHLNPLQEAVQPEGETNTRGVLGKIKDIVDKLDVPVIAKETGCGMAYEEACKLADIHVGGVDVGGAGGTSWSVVEAYRELNQVENKTTESPLGFTFRDWGIPTAASIVETSATKKLKIIGTGGVRSGIDVAKAIALGAHSAGIALPFLKPAYTGDNENLKSTVIRIVRELRTVMYLTGSTDLKTLGKTNLVVRGQLAEWLRMRGFDPGKFAKRRGELRGRPGTQ